MNEDKWSKNGITFRIPTMDDFYEIKLFMKNYYFPDEPITQGSKLIDLNSNGIVNKYLIRLIEKLMIKESLKNSVSMIAIKDGEIVGCRYAFSTSIK